MKKKYADHSEEENEFEVDEPEEIQNNASDDDWTPDKDTSGGRRTSTRLRNIPKSRAPIIDASSTDEEGSDESQGKRKAGRGRGRGRQPAKKHKVSSTSVTSPPAKVTENKSVSSDSEPTSTTTYSSNASPTVVKVNKDFTSGAFVVLKTDVANLEADPPLWKIDGKALLQKYIPFQQEGKTLYKNTSVYSGWTINNKDNYFPVSVIFKQQTRKEHIVEFHRDQIKQGDESEESAEVTSTSEKRVKVEPGTLPAASPTLSGDKPVIKVKAFAIFPEEKICKTEIEENKKSSFPPIVKSNDKDFASGAFLVLKKEAANIDPPLWKIDGKALLQKYCAFKKNGQTLYKNTAEYSGWSSSNQSNYYPVTVIFKQQTKKEHIVEIDRVKWDGIEEDDDEEEEEEED